MEHAGVRQLSALTSAQHSRTALSKHNRLWTLSVVSGAERRSGSGDGRETRVESTEKQEGVFCHISAVGGGMNAKVWQTCVSGFA